MSDNSIKLIPTDPEYVPDAVSQQKARALLGAFVPDSGDVNAVVTEDVEFVSQGRNFIGVFCPVCKTQLSRGWWRDAMFAASEQRFKNLATIMPCCGSNVSLNDLRYAWPAGFARFTLEAVNPNSYGLSTAQVDQLEQVLGCDLRQIWAHL